MLSATPSSGARIHRRPSSVLGPGNADNATTAIATYIVTTVAMPPNTERGRSTPGRRASAARLATVSRPVNASIASGRAKASDVPGGMRAERRAVRERVRREDEREAEHDEQQLRQQVERRDDDPDARRATGAERAARSATKTITATADDDVPRVAIERGHTERAGEVVRQEERRERDHDQVVEEERPAGEEPGEVVRARGGRTSRHRRSRAARRCPRRRRARRSGRAAPTPSRTSGVKPSA